ncbi:hypothetical protein NIES2135_20550 [Leptolyngbya boryana NIES-2135]|jgi:hypothetical protein|uniref:Uncharacterized protein n=1 Tax=Leptolyngbya boryana NIES-2135 TaxID=1973484 RepID=A0A1Z4JEN9_LEPBY|nr:MULTISPECIES: hypothetical protein [Leptolyngbya]BAY55232.1 hypothetical protein NIES2135_20550 [Leptolyngbya boryana NIES-2135]MBD2369318.1 hypothetical protein [Leptolyngbya sp. FACHB-161]MBD2375680.1 hypothetical protein [Leptolyngbya sp. FACHB-238]MBD2401029.1 hypothetical protein [Leptolyngbya sp. FACHB-239]MBD2406614.1 hypothetical protein [Leptolyngbya sp. FACHB-402]
MIDKDLFGEHFNALCDQHSKNFGSETYRKFYTAIAERMTTEEFVQVAEQFFFEGKFPAPKDFVDAVHALRRSHPSPPEQLPPTIEELPPEQQAEARAAIKRIQQMLKAATPQIAKPMPIPTAEECIAGTVFDLDRLRQWLKDPATRRIAIAEAMSREDIEILTDDFGNPIDLSQKMFGSKTLPPNTQQTKSHQRIPNHALRN